MSKLKTSNSDIVKMVLEHPDREEIITKLISEVDVDDINEWLKAKYINVDERKFIISTKNLLTFKDNHLDIYTIIQEDLNKTKTNQIEDLNLAIQGTPAYHRALEKLAGEEVNIKDTVRKMVVNIETRISQIYDILMEDPQNLRNDITLINWFNVLAGILEKYDIILNGSPSTNINVQNNINIQVIDDHINVVYDIIKEILNHLDYDTSLLFIEMFNERMEKLKSSNQDIIPIEQRLNATTALNQAVSAKFNR